MKSTRNSDRLRDILLSTRHQIVALKDIQIDLMCLDAKVANQVATQTPLTYKFITPNSIFTVPIMMLLYHKNNA